MQSRDQLAYEVYQSILQTQRGDWIDLIHCAPMASQYHMSVYSTLKFGSNGAPYAYLPLSLQQPGVTESVLAKQRWLEMHAWRLQLHSSGDPERPDSLSAMKITAEISDSPQERFAEDLQCAKEDASKAAVASSPAAMIIKTSDSHPIKCVRKTHTKCKLGCSCISTARSLAACVSAPPTQLERVIRRRADVPPCLCIPYRAGAT